MPYTVLLVDDDREFRQEFCESLCDYTVIEAEDGNEALRILARPNTVDIVILDVMLPGSSGIDVMRQIKKKDPALPILILTGFSSKDIAIDALKAHADDYLEKPVDVENACQRIEDLLGERRRKAGKSGRGIDAKIAQAQEFARRNCQKKICLADVARAVCLSAKYFSRIFEERTGQRFTEYRLGLKMEKAKEMLAADGTTVDHIADELGYKNAESFIRQFKKFAGRTPSGFRSAARKKRDRRCRRR